MGEKGILRQTPSFAISLEDSEHLWGKVCRHAGHHKLSMYSYHGAPVRVHWLPVVPVREY